LPSISALASSVLISALISGAGAVTAVLFASSTLASIFGASSTLISCGLFKFLISSEKSTSISFALLFFFGLLNVFKQIAFLDYLY
jgi:hypothetical protein